MPLSPLKLSFLGPPEIYYSGQSITFRTRKALALLIYLATESGQQPREKLTALLWPESDTTRGRGMLRTSLVHLREEMDSFKHRYLCIERQTLGFDDTQHVDLDLHLLQKAVDTLEQTQASKAGDALITQLQKATDAYRGDFLEGFTLPDTPVFDDWVTLQREMWHGRACRLFEALSQGYFERGELERGIETATRWQSHDPFSEAAAARLMQLYFADNDRSAALQTYAGYQRMLDEEFGAAPSAEITALAARIRASSVPPRPPNALTTPHTPADLTFVGRDIELEQLQTIFRQSSQGTMQVALLVGEAGIGKTRLATEFLRWATAQGADILSGRAFEAGGRLPYQSLIQCLRSRLARENAPDDLLSDIWLAELSRLLPELRDRYPDLALPLPDETTAQARLFEAITRLGQAFAQRAPLLLSLDDVQWIDIASLDALQFALSSWCENRLPIFILLSVRSEALTAPSDLQRWLAHLPPHLPIARFELRNLPRENILELVTALQSNLAKGAHPADKVADLQPIPFKFDTFAESLFLETRGHPFFVTETLKAIQEQNVLVPIRTGDGGRQLVWRTLAGETTGRFPILRIIPISVRQAILDRLAQLTPAAKTLLTSAAVLGQEATFDQLCAISAFDEMAALEALEELISRHLLLEREELAPTYLIAHDLMRGVLYEEMGATRKRVLHRRAMAVLSDGDSARLAYHALATGDNEAAFQYSMAAGDAAFALSAATEAANHYQTARNLLDDQAISVPEITVYQHLYSRLGRALELDDQFDQALAIYETLGQLAKEHNAPNVALAALMAQTTIVAVGGSPLFQPSRAETLLSQAANLSHLLADEATEAELLWRMTQVYAFSGRFPQAISQGEQALTLARKLDLPEQTAYILGDLALAYITNLQMEQALTITTETAELWQRLGNPPMQIDTLSKLMGIYVYLGQYERALALSTEAYQISRSINNVWGQWQSLFLIEHIHWERGQPGQAIRVLDDVIRIGEQGSYPVPLTISRANLALVYGRLGLVDRGLETARLALEADAQFPMFSVHIMAVLAYLHLKQGQLDKAQAMIDHGRADPKFEGHPIWAIFLPLVEAELSIHQAEYVRARQISEDLLATLRHSGIRIYLPAALYFCGQACLGQNQPEAARTCWTEAQTIAIEMGARQWLWQSLYALSQLEDDPTEAQRLHRQAREIVNFIVAHTPPDFQDALRDLPEVQAVLVA